MGAPRRTQPLYVVNLDHQRFGRLLSVTGERPTVIEAALHVMLDAAEQYDPVMFNEAPFKLSVWRIERTAP